MGLIALICLICPALRFGRRACLRSPNLCRPQASVAAAKIRMISKISLISVPIIVWLLALGRFPPSGIVTLIELIALIFLIGPSLRFGRHGKHVSIAQPQSGGKISRIIAISRISVSIVLVLKAA